MLVVFKNFWAFYDLTLGGHGVPYLEKNNR